MTESSPLISSRFLWCFIGIPVAITGAWAFFATGAFFVSSYVEIWASVLRVLIEPAYDLVVNSLLVAGAASIVGAAGCIQAKGEKRASLAFLLLSSMILPLVLCRLPDMVASGKSAKMYDCLFAHVVGLAYCLVFLFSFIEGLCCSYRLEKAALEPGVYEDGAVLVGAWLLAFIFEVLFVIACLCTTSENVSSQGWGGAMLYLSLVFNVLWLIRYRNLQARADKGRVPPPSGGQCAPEPSSTPSAVGSGEVSAAPSNLARELVEKDWTVRFERQRREREALRRTGKLG